MRLLTAVVELVSENGLQAVTVASISQRAGVSRKTFYDIFADREACLLAAYDDALAQARKAVREAYDHQASWNVRVRCGLRALLGFLDERPGLSRLIVIEAMSAGSHVIERRAEALDELIAVVDEGRAEIEGPSPPSLTAEAIVGAVVALINARLLDRVPDGASRPLSELAGELMGVIVHPYLGPLAARKEIDEPLPTAPRTISARVAVGNDPFKGIPIRLTYRTARVLASIGASPGASNKQIAAASGVTDEGQMSRLLTRLARYELVCDVGGQPTKGEARAWTLTDRGESLLGAAGVS
jgi:AcrR family transcriptional regulator